MLLCHGCISITYAITPRVCLPFGFQVDDALSSIAFSFILAVMLIIAGIGLIKGREKGRVMSIRYAWTSIGMKMVTFIYTIVVVIPATKRMTDTLYQGLPGGLGNSMGSVMQYSQLFSIIMTCAYPIVVLIIMKGQKIKEYLAGR